MLIGLTYDLRDDYIAAGFTEEQAAGFETAETIDAVDAALQFYGHDVERVGSLRQLMQALNDGRRWDLVFNLCTGIAGTMREAQVPMLLEAFGQPFAFSPPEVLAIAMDKAMAKLVLKAAGVPTPDFTLVRNMRDLQRLDMKFPLFVKPVASAGGRGVKENSRVADKAELANRCIDVLKLWQQPALVEAYMPGREFTVGIVGTGPSAHAIGTAEFKFAEGAEGPVLSATNRANGSVSLDLLGGDAAAAIEDVAVRAWRALGCRDAGKVDIRYDVWGKPQVLEVNPMASLRPEIGDLPRLAELAGFSHGSLMGLILDEAAGRVRS